MLVPVSVPLELVLLVPPGGVFIAPLEVVESATGPVVLAADSAAGVLVEVRVPVSLSPQLLSTRPPSSNAARGKRGVGRCIEMESEGKSITAARVYGNKELLPVSSKLCSNLWGFIHLTILMA
jgi:hypothetical protein